MMFEPTPLTRRAPSRAIPILLLSMVLLLAHAMPGAAQAPPPPPPVTDAEVQDQIQKLDVEAIEVRDAAQNQLKKWVVDNRLTPAQIAMIKAAQGDPSPERSGRARAVFSAYLEKNTAIRAVLDPVTVKLTYVYDPMGGYTVYIRLGPFFGESGWWNPQLAELKRRWEAVRDAVLSGNTVVGADGKDAITRAVDKFREFIEQLPPSEFDKLKLKKPNGTPATKQDVINKIYDARDAIPGAKNVISSVSGGDSTPPTLGTILPGAPSHAHLGRGLSVMIDEVALGSSLDVAWVTDPWPVATPPLGYEFVGQVFDIVVLDSLVAQGTVTVAIAYGDAPVGHPVVDPSALQIARCDGGSLEILPSQVDLVGQWVIASFALPAAGSGMDAIGEIALVQPSATAAVPFRARSAAVLDEPWPNPFRSTTSMAFSLTRPARVELDVFDVRGARVRRLVREFAPAGRREVTWDGRGESGQPAGPGLYFVRLRSGAAVQDVRTVTRMR